MSSTGLGKLPRHPNSDGGPISLGARGAGRARAGSPRVPGVDEATALPRKGLEEILAERLWGNPGCGPKTRRRPGTRAPWRIWSRRPGRSARTLRVLPPERGDCPGGGIVSRPDSHAPREIPQPRYVSSSLSHTSLTVG
ncbi:hypothetical protein [Streptomyces sp. NPDC056105]|uniref:hypothetical protein n=1 Tax=Streptomyces sp. NPDC056105 TaxID=3345714 RepID=UPI0035E2ADD6